MDVPLTTSAHELIAISPEPSSASCRVAVACAASAACSLVISPSSLFLRAKTLYLRSTVKFHVTFASSHCSPFCRKTGDACLIRQSSDLPIGRQNFYFIKETLASSLDFLNISSIAFTYSSKVITTEDPTKL